MQYLLKFPSATPPRLHSQTPLWAEGLMCLQPQTNEGDSKRQARTLGGGVKGGRRKATTQQQDHYLFRQPHAFKLTFGRSLTCMSLPKLAEPDHTRIVPTSGAFMSCMTLPEVKRNPSSTSCCISCDLAQLFMSTYMCRQVGPN